MEAKFLLFSAMVCIGFVGVMSGPLTKLRNKRQVNKEWVNGLQEEADAAERELVAETVVKKMREMANRPVRNKRQVNEAELKKLKEEVATLDRELLAHEVEKRLREEQDLPKPPA